MNSIRIFIPRILLCLTVFSLSCESVVKYERPTDNWAFRSVLDGKPRMLNLMLNTNLYVSYDLQRGKLYKAWHGGIKLDGAVYTTAHGVQPTSYGHTYYEDNSTTNQWRLRKDGLDEKPEINYIGHQFKRGQVVIEYELISKSGEKIRIKETPEYLFENEKTGLVRKFELVNNSSDYTPVLSFFLDEEQQPFIEMRRGKLNKSETIGSIELTNKKVVFESMFQPVAFQLEKNIEPAMTEVDRGAIFMKSNDCKICHLKHDNLVGPSYEAIAKKYPYTIGEVTRLADKIINGGSGAWGETMMTPHKDLPKGRAEQMAHYILSLDGETKPKTKVSQLFLDVPSIEFKLDDRSRKTKEKISGKGVVVNYYMLDNDDILYKELTKKSLPAYNGIAPAIHLAGNDSVFKKGSRTFYAEFKGYIKSERAQNKYFRIISKDGSKLHLNGKEVIDNGERHWHKAKDAQGHLKKGLNEFKVQHFCVGTNYAISLQWSDDGKNFSIVPESVLSYSSDQFEDILPYVSKDKLIRYIPGDTKPLNAVHPSFDVATVRPEGFNPRIGGIDFLSEEEMIICTWDSIGAVYVVKNYQSKNPENIKIKQIAKGLAEPLGIKVVDDEIYVLQKQELTKLIDNDGDEIIDEYQKVANSWAVTDHYHEFAFGLVYKEGSFYATLATDLGKEYSAVKDRGRVIKIDKETGDVEFVAKGFRTPNGIAEGPDGAMYVADNQGNWIPTSKIIRVEKDKFYGFKFADFEEVKDLKEDPPLVWLPHGEISNSPSQPAILNIGPFKDQMIHGDVTHGGIKRVFIDEVAGIKQGAVFRFIQGLDAGINRIMWGPDGSLYAGGIGSGGNWNTPGISWYALHRLSYNQKSTFEMLAVRAKSNGMEIELTEAVSESVQLRIEDFVAQQYYYQATEKYGGPKMGVEDLAIAAVHLSDDRKKIFLELDDMKEGYVIYLRIKNPFVSKKEQSLWSTETWYTLNKKPVNTPGFKQKQKHLGHNILSKVEIEKGWKLLFDGKTTNNWHNYLDESVNEKWIVTNKGELHLTGKGGGHIVSDKEYENFELTLDWKIDEGGNSGLMFNVVEDKKYKTPWLTGPEMQMLDNQRHKGGRHEKHRAGDLYDMIACEFVTANEGGQWNTIKLKIKDGHVEHWQNGYKVVEYQLHGEDWSKLISNSKFKKMKDFGKATKGKLCIQDHGDKLWLRNIKIREL